jgi:hypothetical protein
MAEGIAGRPAALTPEERTHAELVASRRELVDAVVRQVAFEVRQMGLSPDEARERHRQTRLADPDAIPSAQISWLDLSALNEEDPVKAQALWQRFKREAAEELAGGVRVSRTLERPLVDDPAERAAFLAVVAGLRGSLAPRDALEHLLVQQMAAAFHLHLRWQEIAVRRMEEEVWQAERDKRRTFDNMSPRERERYEDNHGWLPPRLAEREALEQAAVLSDRYQRSFLRLMKAFRDNRKLFASLIVAGGQVNIGEQQVNVAGHAAAEPGRQAGQTRRGNTTDGLGDEGRPRPVLHAEPPGPRAGGARVRRHRPGGRGDRPTGRPGPGTAGGGAGGVDAGAGAARRVGRGPGAGGIGGGRLPPAPPRRVEEAER